MKLFNEQSPTSIKSSLGPGSELGGKAPPFPSSPVRHFARFVTDFSFFLFIFCAVSPRFLPFYPTMEPDPRLIKTGSRLGEQVRAPNQLGGL